LNIFFLPPPRASPELFGWSPESQEMPPFDDPEIYGRASKRSLLSVAEK